MRILVVNYEYPPLGGGGGVATHDVAVELSKRHEIHVLTSAAPGLAEEEQIGNIRIFRAPVWGRTARSTASFLSMVSFWPIGNRYGAALIERFSYDVIHTWFAVPSGPVGRYLARRSAVPEILTLAGGDVYDPSKWYTPDKNPLLARIVRSVMDSADHVTAVSTDLARRTRQIYGFTGNIEVVRLGLTPRPFAQATRADLGLDADKIYLISVSRLVKRKSLDSIIKALAALDMPDVQALIVGDGPELNNLKRLAAELNIVGQVHFRGFVPEDEKYQLLANADIFTLPSLHEAFGLGFVEGMLAHLPVIATHGGGQGDFLEDNKTGYFIQPRDVETLTARLRHLCERPDIRRKMGAYNAEKAKSLTIAQTAGHFEKIMLALTRKPRHQAA